MTAPISDEEIDLLRYGYPGSEIADERAANLTATAYESMRGDFLTTFGSAHGESDLAYLYDYCGGGDSSFRVGESHDAMAFREGKRKVLLWIQGILRMDDEAIFRIARGARKEG